MPFVRQAAGDCRTAGRYHRGRAAMTPQAQRLWLPNRRAGVVVSFDDAGQRYRASGSYQNGKLVEIFLDTGKCGSAVQLHADNAAILASLCLQFGVDVEVVRHSISGPIAIALDLLSDEGER